MVLDMLNNLKQNRDDLLREYMLARGAEKARVLAKILEIDEQIEEEKARQPRKEQPVEQK